MKLIAPLVLALAALLVLPACNTQEKYAQNNAAADAWLQAQSTSSPQINVTGSWTVPGWGGAALEQTGRELVGEMGNYRIKGVVSGYRAYITAYDGGWVYYTMILKKPSSSKLEGVYSSSVPFSVTDAQPIAFQRLQL